MVLVHEKAPPPPQPWEDAPEVEYRLHKNQINMARAYDPAMVTMKRLIVRESANESEGTQFVTDEDSLDTADGKLHIHKIPQLPISKNKYFIVVMYPPEDLGIDDTPMDGDKPVKFLFSFYNLYLTGFSYDEIWHIFDDAMIVGISQESRDKYVKELAFAGDYKTIRQDYLKLDIGFDGQCDTYNKIVGIESGKTNKDQLIRVLCRTTITLPESARFAFLAQFHLINFHLGNFDAVLDMEVLEEEEYRNFSLHLTKWGTYSTMSKNGKKFFKASAIPTSGIQSFNCLLNFIAVATNKKYDDDKNELESEVVKARNTEDDHTDDKGGKKGLYNNNEDSKENKKNVQDNGKTWFYQAPVMPYVPHRGKNLNLVAEAVQAASITNSKGEVKYPNKSINILQTHGKSAKGNCLLNGYVLNLSRAVQGSLDFNLHETKLQMGVQVLVSDPSELEKIGQRESNITKERIEKVLKVGANVVFTTKGIDDMSLKVPTFADMEDEETFDPSFPGHPDEVVEEMISDNETILVKDTKNTSVDSVLLRGANSFMLDEFEPSLHDALFILKRTLESNMVVAGSGAVEAALSVYLENQATTLGSREHLAIGESAESLLITPKVHNELTLEGPSESPGIGKARLVECMSQPVCGPNILTANLDGKCAWNWYADRAQEGSERHDHCPLGRLVF